MPVIQSIVDREAAIFKLPISTWKQFTVSRMQQEREVDAGLDRLKYEVVKTYNPRGFLGSNKHYAMVEPSGKLRLLTEVQARMMHGEDVGLYGYVECDEAWKPMRA